MPTSRSLLTFLLAGVLLSIGAAPARAWDFQLGMGDQQARMFSDPRFERIGFEHARVVTPYDVVCQPDVQQQYYLDVWLAAAKRAEARPLVAFSFSLREGQRWKLPSYRRFLSCFRAFRKRYPQVQDFNPWNEANHSAQPTFRHPKKAAGFYNALRRVCPRCNVAAGDLLDWSHFGRWLERYRAHLRGPVRLWSMHNYLDINRRRSWERSSTRADAAPDPRAPVDHRDRRRRPLRPLQHVLRAARRRGHPPDVPLRLRLARASRASTPTTGRPAAIPTPGIPPGFAPTARPGPPTACWSARSRASSASVEPPPRR